jgi:hypothetical protein
LGGTYPSVVRLRFGPGLGLDGSFGMADLNFSVAAVAVALWVAHIPLVVDSSSVPVVVAEPVAVLTGQTEKAEAVGYAVECTLFFRCLADMDFAVSLALLSSRLC